MKIVVTINKNILVALIIMMPQWYYGAKTDNIRQTAAVMSGAVAGTRAGAVVGTNLTKMAAQNVYVGFTRVGIDTPKSAESLIWKIARVPEAQRDAQLLEELLVEGRGIQQTSELIDTMTAVNEIWRAAGVETKAQSSENFLQLLSEVHAAKGEDGMGLLSSDELIGAVRAFDRLQLGKAVELYDTAATQGEAMTGRLLAAGGELEEIMATAAMIETAMLVINLVLLVAYTTMPYWLPLIYKQSGIGNHTLYESHAFIDFQAAAGTSCSRAHFTLCPYNRKDLGCKSWQQVGGDRGRSCLPEKYHTRMYLACGGVTLIMESSKKELTKQFEMFSFAFPQKKGDRLSIVWKST